MVSFQTMDEEAQLIMKEKQYILLNFTLILKSVNIRRLFLLKERNFKKGGRDSIFFFNYNLLQNGVKKNSGSTALLTEKISF